MVATFSEEEEEEEEGDVTRLPPFLRLLPTFFVPTLFPPFLFAVDFLVFLPPLLLLLPFFLLFFIFLFFFLGLPPCRFRRVAPPLLVDLVPFLLLAFLFFLNNFATFFLVSGYNWSAISGGSPVSFWCLNLPLPPNNSVFICESPLSSNCFIFFSVMSDRIFDPNFKLFFPKSLPNFSPIAVRIPLSTLLSKGLLAWPSFRKKLRKLPPFRFFINRWSSNEYTRKFGRRGDNILVI